jgi:phage repressor protein C with HTH and peptisase S24 domain
MLAFKEVIEKLKDILSESRKGRKVFDKDVADMLGIPQSTFATMKKRNSIPYEEILEFCALRRISVNWLFFDQAIDMLKAETDKFFQVRYFANIRASAGGGAEVFNEAYEMLTLDRKLLDTVVGGSAECVDAIHLEGESMEPTLQDGSIIFIDRSHCSIEKEGIFVLSTLSGLFIKRIEHRADGMMALISDNPLYPPQLIPQEELEVVGKVIGNIERV